MTKSEQRTSRSAQQRQVEPTWEIISLSKELEIILEDYKTKASSADGQLALAQQVFSLTITTIGLLLAASTFIVDKNAYLVFGVSSFLFYGLALTQLRHALAVAAISAYVSDTLRPRIISILKTLPRDEHQPDPEILNWESGQVLSAYAGKWWQLPLEGARYLIPLVAGVTFLVAYLIGQPDLCASESLAVIILNGLAIIYIAFLSIMFRRNLVLFLQGRKISHPFSLTTNESES